MPDDDQTPEQDAIDGNADTPSDDDATVTEAAPEDSSDGASAEASIADPGEQAAPAVAGGLPAEVAQSVGEGAERLLPFARHAAEVMVVGLERVVARTAQVHDVSVSVTEYPEVEREFSELDHVGFELRVALTETEAYLAAVLVPMEDLGSLFSLDVSAERLADEEYVRAQLDTIAAGTRELLDLVSLTLFTEGLAGAEITLADHRRGQIDYSMGMVADVAQGVPPVRVDFELRLPDERITRITLVLPTTLLSRIAELLGSEEEADVTAAVGAGVPEPVTAGVASAGAGAPEPPGFGLGDEGRNVTPLRPDIGGSGGGGDPRHDDTPVHPVRFPPLTDTEGPVGVAHPLDLLMDVSMHVTVELGRSTMMVEEILQLGPGSVVELNKLAGEPVDILVNERLIARGEVVVVDENFGVRVTEIISPRHRAHAMGR